MSNKMTIGELGMTLNSPEALSGNQTFGLPPYREVFPYLVDDYEGCPSNWMRSDAKTKSYFVGLEEGKGLWFDFNSNENVGYHVAVVISVQGVNPITGMPCKDYALEQYITRCPKHDVEFGADRHCPECGYNWPKQNYLCTTGTPKGSFWLDGFKSIDGVVRQYILTAETMRGVAANVIGEDRVFAIGATFFLSKTERILPPVYRTSPFLGYKNNNGDYFSNCEIKGGYQADFGHMNYLSSTNGDQPQAFMCHLQDVGSSGTVTRGMSARKSNKKSLVAPKLEVAAGAKINQRVHNDPETLEFWRDEPEGIICVNYCSTVQLKEILDGGKKEKELKQEGFLQDIPVGN